MSTTYPPNDLTAFAAGTRQVTGLPADAVGVVGNQPHILRGGYHVGKGDLIANGNWGDYSSRLPRDVRGATNAASAVDIGDDWPNGGRAAWLRFNNALIAALPHSAELAAVRAVNYSPDGTQRLRVDREHGFVAIPSTDTVTIHTHVEFYRDTNGGRAAALAALTTLMREAIAPPAPTTTPNGDEPPMFLATQWLGDGPVPADAPLYVCDGITSRPIERGDAQTMLYGKGSGYGPTFPALLVGDPNRNPSTGSREWADLGSYRAAVRMGWGAGWAGAVLSGNSGSAPGVEGGLTHDDVKSAVNEAFSEAFPGK